MFTTNMENQKSKKDDALRDLFGITSERTNGVYHLTHIAISPRHI